MGREEGSGSGSVMTANFTPRDVLAGQLAALLPPLPQATYESVADGLIGLGCWPAPDAAATLALLSAHSFVEDIEGDGWNAPEVWEYRCLCRKSYAQWTQTDPDMTGLAAFREGGHEARWSCTTPTSPRF